jgi:type IV pilus assembly protein PilV
MLSRGVTMLEVLITIVIITLGLLGLAGMQSRMQVSEVESYQRAQAIVLLQEMVDRINANRKNAASYVTADPLGTNSPLDCTAPATQAIDDQCKWSDRLRGAGETNSGGTKIGAMADARGCITNPVATMPREVIVAVVWQGITPTIVPTSTNCGAGLYGDDKTRRAMIARIKVGCLQNDLTTGLCVTP